MGTISKNFSYSEFEESTTAQAHGILNIIDTVEKRDAIKALVLEVLQPLRDVWGAPLHINSGYRCQELNAYVGGQPSSQHLKGEACDIKTGDEMQSYRLASVAKQLGVPFDQMILYPTFVHFSHRLKGTQRRQILYNKSYKGERL